MGKDWLKKRRRDFYYRKAKLEGLRSRAAYKLEQLDKKFKIFKGVKKVLDLCCAPGGWLQYSLSRIGDDGLIIGVDLVEIAPLPNVYFIRGDITREETLEKIVKVANGKIDLVLSDCSPNVSGIWELDHARQIYLAETSLKIARKVLRKGGKFVVKVFQGDLFNNYLDKVRAFFKMVKVTKPEASRKESAEMYIIAFNFNG
ncbi:MAG: RlmE family RNA methyltransferase [Candidatus Odinarchaeota archaeon]|nr:RlmE family RNA methyltransferase [Candidatus Odinarchaeota archaeon]